MSDQRKAILEIDVMKGSKLPPGEVSSRGEPNPPVEFEGRTFTLKDIFSRANLNLQISASDQEIPMLGDGNVSDGDLNDLMETFSKRPASSDNNNNMYAYFVIVNGLIMRPGGDGILRPAPGILGAMWDQGFRKGTAVFYKNELVNTQPIAYLRTSAHEIGHQFNLHHRDGDVTNASGTQKKFSIMNQTGVIMEYGGWPQGISLEFGPLEVKHLSSHDIRFVAPGKSPFSPKCDIDHDQWHNEAPSRLGVMERDLTTFDGIPEKELDFQIQMGKEKYLPGQPSISYLKLTNVGSKDLSLIDKLTPEYNIVKFYIKKGEEGEVRFMPYVFYEFVPEKTILKLGESIYGRAKIFYGANGYTFPEPGTYTVRAEYHGLNDGLGTIIQSNPIEVIIREPENKEEEEQVKLIKGKEQALVLLFEGGDHLNEGINQLTKLAQQYPQSILGGYANAVLGLHWSRQFKDFKNNRVREPNYDMARLYLETASDKVKGYWANAAYLNLAEIYKRTGDKARAKDVLNDYINKFDNEIKNINGTTTAKKLLLNDEI
jgi:Tetratricopeptide repeat